MRQDDLLKPCFENINSVHKKENIKSSTERDVFTIKSDKTSYFVKYSHPTGLFQKIRASFSPKLIKEFYAIKMLQKFNISTPKPVAAGFNGSKSILITTAVENASDVRTFWFEHCGEALFRTTFLSSYAEFLKKILDTQLFHPDFHPGNILVRLNNDSFEFFLIDVYGILPYEKLPDSKYFMMLTILGAMRGELSDLEATDLISKITDYSNNKASSLWQNILLRETKKTEKLWKKRKNKVFQNSKYTILVSSEKNDVLIRKTMTGRPYININEINNNDFTNQWEQKNNSQEAAKDLWSYSFRMEFHRIPEKFPVAMILNKNSNNALLLFDNNYKIRHFLPQRDLANRKKLLNSEILARS